MLSSEYSSVNQVEAGEQLENVPGMLGSCFSIKCWRGRSLLGKGRLSTVINRASKNCYTFAVREHEWKRQVRPAEHRQECEATALQRFEEAFRGALLQHQSLRDSRHLLEVAKRDRQRHTPPEKKGVPSAGQLHSTLRPGGAAEEHNSYATCPPMQPLSSRPWTRRLSTLRSMPTSVG